MSFLAPWFLLGLLTVVVPLLIHLRRSRRAVRIVFSTTRFFDEQFMRSARRARIQDIILMALRMALLCLLAFALAQPALTLPRLRGLLGLGAAPRCVAVVLDNSASMGLRDDRGPLLARAREAALAVLQDLSPLRGDRAVLVTAGRRDAGPEAPFPEPTDDLDAVRDAVRRTEPTDLGTDLATAVNRAAALVGAAPDATGAFAAKGGIRREIYVFSDMQASGLEGSEPFAVGPLASLILVDVPPAPASSRDNVSVDAIQYGASRPLVGVPFSFRVLLRNHDRRPRTVTARLSVAGQDLSRKRVELPAGRGRVVRFAHRFAKSGWAGGAVSLDFDAGDPPDAIEADNTRHFAVQVHDRLRVLAVNGAPSALPAGDELFFFRLALRAAESQGDAASSAGTLQMEEVQPEAIVSERLRDAAVVVLANVRALTPDAVQCLERFVDGGGSLLVTLGDRVDAQAYAQWVGPHRMHGGLLPASVGPTRDAAPAGGATDAAGFVAWVDNSHPAMAGFGDDALGTFSAVRFRRSADLDAGESSVLMSDTGGRPLLVEKGFGKGRVMMFAGTLDREWSDLPLQPVFVPWVYRTLAYLSCAGPAATGFVPTGRIVPLPLATAGGESFRIELPDGRTAYPEPDPAAEAGRASAVVPDTSRAGLYALRPTSGDAAPALLFAANIPDEESETEYLDSPALEAFVRPDAAWAFVPEPGAAARAGRTARQGFGLWDHFLALALVVALVEPWLANRFSRRQGRLPKPAPPLSPEP